MRSLLVPTVIVAVLSMGVLLTGCGQPAGKGPSGKPATPTLPVEKKAEAPKPEPKAAEAGKKATPEGLAELSEADLGLAEKQKVCPVSGTPLGSMGKPVKVEVKGRTVFLCCGACEADLKKDPDKFLAKLDAAAKK
jgi:YHS domain-containing protein